MVVVYIRIVMVAEVHLLIVPVEDKYLPILLVDVVHVLTIPKVLLGTYCATR